MSSDETRDPSVVAVQTAARQRRHDNLEARTFSAQQRELAAAGREDGAVVREQASAIRAQAALVRDDAARTRDDGARVRDRAAVVRDLAARARHQAVSTREEALALRLKNLSADDRAGWERILELDRLASAQSREATTHDRDAAALDRTAADKDREAADRDRAAAGGDRDASDKDHDAACRDRQAADADRAAADSDREDTQRDLSAVEQQLARTQRVAALGQFAASMAHELNNPLAALQLTLATMKLELQAPSPGTLDDVLHDAQVAADRITHVVADMKAWLRGGDNQPSRTLVDLQKVIDDALRLANAEVSAAAKVVLDVRPTAPLYGVASRLGQVLTNLLLNAASAMSGPAANNELRVSAWRDDAAVHIEVHDTGAGIPLDVLPHIFDPFFTTREGKGGTGLGLAVAERIVAEHGGTLTVDTELGKGTTFRVRLPASAQQQPSKASAASDRARVLVIDDDVNFARSMVRLLSRRYEVAVAADGSEGLAKLLAVGASYDLVLCDIMMPVMNGLELYRCLRDVSPSRAASLVFMSGGATTTETADFMAALPNVQLQKPFDAPALLALIDARHAANARPAP